MKDFAYAAATSVDEAVSLLAAGGENARILAGGSDIIPQLREGQREANLVVDVKKIPELMEIQVGDDGLRLGAAAPCYRVYENARIVADYPALVDAARIIGGWQIQSRASIGGNVCNASPAADSIPPLIAYDAVCHIAGPSGRRTAPVVDFCVAPGRTVLKRGEILTSIWLPARTAKSGAAYLRFIPRNEMDIAVVGAGSWLQLDAAGEMILDARIALAAVAPHPVLAEEAGKFLVGKPATEQSFAAAGELAKQVATPISDMRGPAEYRLHLVSVLTKRTLVQAAERAAPLDESE